MEVYGRPLLVVGELDGAAFAATDFKAPGKGSEDGRAGEVVDFGVLFVDKPTLGTEVGDIAGLRTFRTCGEAAACRIAGDGAFEVILTVAVVTDVGHFVTGPLIEVVAVSIPSVNINCRPAKVVGELDSDVINRISPRLGDGFGNRIGNRLGDGIRYRLGDGIRHRIRHRIGRRIGDRSRRGGLVLVGSLLLGVVKYTRVYSGCCIGGEVGNVGAYNLRIVDEVVLLVGTVAELQVLYIQIYLCGALRVIERIEGHGNKGNSAAVVSGEIKAVHIGSVTRDSAAVGSGYGIEVGGSESALCRTEEVVVSAVLVCVGGIDFKDILVVGQLPLSVNHHIRLEVNPVSNGNLIGNGIKGGGCLREDVGVSSNRQRSGNRSGNIGLLLRVVLVNAGVNRGRGVAGQIGDVGTDNLGVFDEVEGSTLTVGELHNLYIKIDEGFAGRARNGIEGDGNKGNSAAVIGSQRVAVKIGGVCLDAAFGLRGRRGVDNHIAGALGGTENVGVGSAGFVNAGSFVELENAFVVINRPLAVDHQVILDVNPVGNGDLIGDWIKGSGSFREDIGSRGYRQRLPCCRGLGRHLGINQIGLAGTAGLILLETDIQLNEGSVGDIDVAVVINIREDERNTAERIAAGDMQLNEGSVGDIDNAVAVNVAVVVNGRRRGGCRYGCRRSGSGLRLGGRRCRCGCRGSGLRLGGGRCRCGCHGGGLRLGGRRRGGGRRLCRCGRLRYHTLSRYRRRNIHLGGNSGGGSDRRTAGDRVLP